MSRIGQSPIPIPSGVDVSVSGRHVTVKGPKGQLERDLPGEITIRQEGEELLLEVGGASKPKTHQLKWATTFGEVAPGEPLLYEDSYGRLCIAVNQGNAAKLLDLVDNEMLAISRPRLPAIHHGGGDGEAEKG